MLLLASASPRRRELLESAGIPFRVSLPDGVDESLLPDEDPETYVRRLARAKALAVARSPGDTVLAADTTVVLEHHILGKPEDARDAARMLRLLSGREHQVLTGVCLLGPGFDISDVATTRVWFLPLSESDIDQYVRSGEPMDKAGAYGIQGLASKFIERIDGCYFNVVGLPISLVYRYLRERRPFVI